ncbi:isoflavone reductase family protein [Aspergillus pseudoustus]|uniref:Isoflavone reductase family protein n=1 Tax=Aspergillus pseudoustus TaxID=1810923 RepID=A0ABR4J5X7_9EURO
MAIRVGVIGATGTTGGVVVNGLLSSDTDFLVTSFTREASVTNTANQKLKEKGVGIVGYDLDAPSEQLVEKLAGIDILISCMTWEHLHLQLLWIEAAKQAGVKRFVPSEWAGPAPRGILDIKDKKLEILGAIQRARLPYTIIDIGCWYQVWVPKVPSGRSDHAHRAYVDHRIVNDGDVPFALTDLPGIGKYVAQIVVDPRTINKRVVVYTEVLSMNEVWETMAKASGETPVKDYVTEPELHEIIATCRARLDASPEAWSHPDNIMDAVNFSMGQYRISWCIRGDNTPEYANYLGYLNFWTLYPDFPKGRSLEAFYRSVLEGDF